MTVERARRMLEVVAQRRFRNDLVGKRGGIRSVAGLASQQHAQRLAEGIGVERSEALGVGPGFAVSLVFSRTGRSRTRKSKRWTAGHFSVSFTDSGTEKSWRR